MPKGPKTNHPISTTHRPGPYHQSRRTMTGASPVLAERHTSSPWNTADDNQLMHARQKGLNWAPIASTYFPTKTANACRKRHERLMEKRNSADTWDGGKIEQLAKAYTDVREEMWSLLAKRVDEKWQDVERKVWSPNPLCFHPLCFPRCSSARSCDVRVQSEIRQLPRTNTNTNTNTNKPKVPA